ncbi:MAG: hypothetical protein CMM93_04175 [Rickettsiales bacterium]|nr:hypothetical protein [Rickettsiales bacterium]|tara:strand:- start:2439 stop:3110 length:672 start_codon:yes stop_codon:yes gene_type:complete
MERSEDFNTVKTQLKEIRDRVESNKMEFEHFGNRLDTIEKRINKIQITEEMMDNINRDMVEFNKSVQIFTEVKELHNSLTNLESHSGAKIKKSLKITEVKINEENEKDVEKPLNVSEFLAVKLIENVVVSEKTGTKFRDIFYPKGAIEYCSANENLQNKLKSIIDPDADLLNQNSEYYRIISPVLLDWLSSNLPKYHQKLMEKHGNYVRKFSEDAENDTHTQV